MERQLGLDLILPRTNESAEFDGQLDRLLARARDDEHPLVRETAAHFAGAARGRPQQPGTSLASIEVMHLLHAAPFFAELDPGDLADLAELATEETIQPPAVICEAGDADSDALFVVLEGRAAVVSRPAESSSTPRTLATLVQRPGAARALLGVLARRIRSLVETAPQS